MQTPETIVTPLVANIMFNISNVKVNVIKKQASNNMTAAVNCKYISNQPSTRGHIIFQKIRECPSSRVRKHMQATLELSNNSIGDQRKQSFIGTHNVWLVDSHPKGNCSTHNVNLSCMPLLLNINSLAS